MINTGKLAGRTLFITGASRGIGKAIALKAAKDGANIVIAAKTAEPHPKLPGTIYTAAKEIEDNGGKALPCVVDVRDENSVKKAISEAVQKFGGIDIVINNASAISLTATPDTDMKRYDLMHNINTRGTFLVSKECLPHLKKSDHGHILNLSSLLSFAPQVAYTMARGYSSEATGGKVAGLFSKIQTAINPEMGEKINALYEFNISGKEEGVWHIDLRTGNAAAGPGPAPSKPDAILKMNSDKFVDLFSGNLKASMALMTGKLKVSGNLQKAMKLEKLLSSLKDKL